MLDALLWTAVAVSLTTGALVLLLLALRPVLGRLLSPRFLTAVWAVLALRLIFPFAVPLPENTILFSFHPPVQFTQTAVAPAGQDFLTDVVSAPPDAGDTALAGTDFAGQTAADSPDPLLPNTSDQNTGTGAAANNTDPLAQNAASQSAESSASVNPFWAFVSSLQSDLRRLLLSLSPARLLLLLWGAGSAFRLSFELLFSLRFRRSLLRCCSDAVDPALAEQIRAATDEMRMKKSPPVYTCSRISGPMLVGFFHPVLLLPDAGLYTAEDWDCMLRHELTHYRCRHMLYKLMLLLLCCLQWWNPAAYLLRRQADRDLELVCDSWALSGKTASYRAKYGRALLNSASPHRRLGDGCSSCFYREGVRVMKRRLLNIFGKSGRRGSLPALAAILALCLAVSGCVMPVIDSSVQAGTVQTETVSSDPAVLLDGAPPAEIHEISTAGELVAFAEGVNSGELDSESGDWWVLTDDIDLTGIDWEPIGKVPSALRGNRYDYLYQDPGHYVNFFNLYYDLPLIYFDGQGHYVNGMSCSVSEAYGGFFFSVASGSIIRNLNVTGSVIAPCCGGLIGYGNGLIENCSFSGDVQGYRFVGGLVGYGDPDLTVNHCIATANVSGAHSVGGFAGFGGSFSDCYAGGSVSGVSLARQHRLTGLPSDGDTEYVSTVGGFIGSDFQSLENCIADAQMFCYDDSSYFGSFIGRSSFPLGDSCYYNRERNQNWSFGTIQIPIENGEFSTDGPLVTVKEELSGISPQGLSSKEIFELLSSFWTSYTPKSVEGASAIYNPRDFIPAEESTNRFYRRNYLDWFADTGLLEYSFSADDFSALGPTETRSSLANPLFAAFSKTLLLEFVLESPSPETYGKEGWIPRDYFESFFNSFLPCSSYVLHSLFSDCYDPQKNSYYYVKKDPAQQTLIRVTESRWAVADRELILNYELYRVPENAADSWQKPVWIGSGTADLLFDTEGSWTFLSNTYAPIDA